MAMMREVGSPGLHMDAPRLRAPRHDARPLRILVEPSDYVLHHAVNMGDVAMLQVAVSRLAVLWPGARIDVLSDTPDVVPTVCPPATALSSTGRRLWLSPVVVPARVAARLPTPVTDRLPALARQLRLRSPRLAEAVWRRRLRHDSSAAASLHEFVDAVSRADLVVAAGMGGITDAFAEFGLGLLETLALAIRRRRKTAMVGQGIGPLRDPALRALAASVLPRIDVIAVREHLASRPLLDSLGVPAARTVTTGDDTVELAYRLRPERLGGGLGVNVRASDYSGVGSDEVRRLGQVLQDAASARRAPMVSVPISAVPGEADADTIRQLMAGYHDAGDRDDRVLTPVHVIRRIQQCRVVVTGSYHAGVFALSMGVPAIGLAGSPYYADKFRGLSAQFGTGCDVVTLDGSDFTAELSAAIQRSWASADDVRPALLAAAVRQIELGHAAYRRIFELVSGASAPRR